MSPGLFMTSPTLLANGNESFFITSNYFSNFTFVKRWGYHILPLVTYIVIVMSFIYWRVYHNVIPISLFILPNKVPFPYKICWWKIIIFIPDCPLLYMIRYVRFCINYLNILNMLNILKYSFDYLLQKYLRV